MPGAKEHSFKEIVKDIKEDRVPNVILLCGEEGFLVSWAAKKLTERYVDESVKVLDLTLLDGEKASVAEITEAAGTPPVMSEKKVVIVENCPYVRGKAQGDVKELIEYVEDMRSPQQDGPVLLIFTEGRIDDKRKNGDLLSVIEDSGKVYDFGPLFHKDAQRFIVKRFERAGKKISSKAVDMLITESGYDNKNVDYDLFNLENDIKKMVALSDGEEITNSDVLECISDNPEHAVFQMLSAVSAGDKSKAMKLLHGLMDSGENGYKILGIIVSQTELMLELKEMKKDGMTMSSMTRLLKVNSYRAEKAMRSADRYEVGELKDMLALALETDDRIKSGALNEKMALEMLIGMM